MIVLLKTIIFLLKNIILATWPQPCSPLEAEVVDFVVALAMCVQAAQPPVHVGPDILVLDSGRCKENEKMEEKTVMPEL